MSQTPSRSVLALHDAAPTFDLHADTPLLFPLGYKLSKRHKRPLNRAYRFGHVDLPRMADGGLWAQFFGVPVFPYPERRCPRRIHVKIDYLEREIAASAGAMRLCRSAGEVRAARAEGVRAALIGIEGAHGLGGSIDNVAAFARRGVRYMGLLHFTANYAGFPAKGVGRDDTRGLTPFGLDLVDELQRLGVIVDLTHVNRKGFFDAVARAKGPMIVSHTGVNGVTPHWRNLDDDQIQAVAKLGGCIGIIFATRFLGEDSIDIVVRHLDHIRKVGGDGVPALGSDFDGCVVPPRALADAADLPRLTEALLRAKWSEEQVLKLLGGNAMRVLEQVPPKSG